MSDRKDEVTEAGMLKYLAVDLCAKCRAAFPNLDCARCRARRYLNRLADALASKGAPA